MNVSEYDANLDLLELDAVLSGLVSARKSSGIRQIDVAKTMGIGQPSVSEFERGEVEPRVSTLQRYARAVGYKLKLGIEEVGDGDTE